MKTTIQTIAYLQIAALFLTGALPCAVVAETETPFRGSLEAVESHAVQFPTLFVEGSGAGNATLLDQFTVAYDAEVNLVTRMKTGCIELVAANGVRVFADVVGQSTPTGNPDVVVIVEIDTITGGTGRFANATGSFVLERLLDQGTGSTSGSFEGTIEQVHRLFANGLYSASPMRPDDKRRLRLDDRELRADVQAQSLRQRVIVAEQDIRLDAWYFQCHLPGDPVQPGCLGVDAIWQLLGFYAALRGAKGSGRALGSKEIEFFGQIRPHNRVVEYLVKVRRYSELPAARSSLVVGTGEIRVDGELIYTVNDAKVGIFRDITYTTYPHDGRNSTGGQIKK